MKYILTILVIFSLPPSMFSQGELTNKTITTQIEIIPQSDPTTNSTSKNGVTFVQNIGTQEKTYLRETKIKLKSNDLLQISRVIKRIKVKIRIKTEEKIYDSENPFDRDFTTESLGKRYDSYINSPEESIFNVKTNTFENTYRNEMFQSVWQESIRLHPVDEWDYLLLNKPTFSLNEIWTDTIKTKKATFINTYQCLKFNNNQALITLKSQVISNSTYQSRKISNIAITSGISSNYYEGELLVDKNTKLISTITLTHTTQQTSNTMEMHLQSEKSSKISVKNQIKDNTK